MSVSIESMQDFAKMVIDHPALPAVQERINLRLFNRWMAATPEQQKNIRDIVDNQREFYKEIAIIYSDAEKID